MHAAVQNGIPGIEGECGGEMSCGTCHVYISEAWLPLLRPQSEDERDLLDVDDRANANSRLGCQIRMTEELDGLTVEVPGPLPDE